MTNWMDDEDGFGFVGFDDLFAQFQDSVESHMSGFSFTGDLEKIYVQFQYDCAGIPKMVQGTKIGRYSKKHKDVQAYVEVTRAEYQAAEDEMAKLTFFKATLLRILREISGKLEGSVKHNLPDIVKKVESL